MQHRSRQQKAALLNQIISGEISAADITGRPFTKLVGFGEIDGYYYDDNGEPVPPHIISQRVSDIASGNGLSSAKVVSFSDETEARAQYNLPPTKA